MNFTDTFLKREPIPTNIEIIAKLHEQFRRKNTTTQPQSHKIRLRAQAKSYFNSETNWDQKFPSNNDYIMRSEAELKRKWELQNSDKNKFQAI